MTERVVWFVKQRAPGPARQFSSVTVSVTVYVFAVA
jgi:hypothetical protein